MADTPAPLPSLGLLDGLGAALVGGVGAPGPLPSIGLILNDGGQRSVGHPGPIPSLGLLGGFSNITVAGVDNPAPLPSLGLLGGFSQPTAVDAVIPYDHGVPAAWYADVGFTAAYAWHRLGTTAVARDSAPTATMSITLDDGVFAGTATASSPPSLQDLLDSIEAMAAQLVTLQAEVTRLRRSGGTGGGGGAGSVQNSNNAAILAFMGGLIGGNQGE